MLTVVVPTRNRAHMLADVLEAYCQVQSPPSGWKLVVVDNGSTDPTAEVLASFANRLPLQSVAEPRIGQNFARNAGLALAEGDLTVFADDDTFPHADWLVELRKAADSRPEFSLFGGAVAPRWEAPPPPWVRWVVEAPSTGGRNSEVRAGPVYSITDPALAEGPIPPWLVFGGNMAFRSGIFQSGIRFDPAIGPRGSSYPIGGETILLIELGRQGHKAWHVPRAIVEHFIRKEQLAKSWVLARAIRFGRGQYRAAHTGNAGSAELRRSALLHLPPRLLAVALLMLAEGVTFRPQAFFRARWRFNFFWGQVLEAQNLARERESR